MIEFITISDWLLPLALLTPLATAAMTFPLAEQQTRLRASLNLLGACLNLLWVSGLLLGVYQGQELVLILPLTLDLVLSFRADAFALLFVALSGILWLLTTIYALGYLENGVHRSRFFGFFGLCVASTKGIALSGDLLTFFIFYELLTLSTYPLVVHRGNLESLRAGRVYLGYTLAGGALLLIAVVWLYSLTGQQPFIAGGSVSHLVESHRQALLIIFALLVTGFGVKAALVPLHGWLPIAMAAPAPVSALLHAVAVVKAGAFGIVRTVYDVYGATFAHGLGVTDWVAAAAAITIIYGTIRALSQDDIKRRLAYSTVSQVSYITLGTAIAGPLATLGGIVHLVHQGLMKITLFFCAGNLAETRGISKVSQLNGVGRHMPWTMLAFTIGGLGMIGIPPLAGFISKWYLGLGGASAGQSWIIAVLVGSTLLNAAYFLPLLYRAWFCPSPDTTEPPVVRDAKPMLLLPPLITASLVLGVGLFAGLELSPLQWASLITEREYR